MKGCWNDSESTIPSFHHSYVCLLTNFQLSKLFHNQEARSTMDGGCGGMCERVCGVNDQEKPPISSLLVGVFGNKSGWNLEMEDPKPTKKFMEMAINRCVERNGGY